MMLTTLPNDDLPPLTLPLPVTRRSLNDLPEETLRQCATHMHPYTLHRLRRLNRRFNLQLTTLLKSFLFAKENLTQLFTNSWVRPSSLNFAYLTEHYAAALLFISDCDVDVATLIYTARFPVVSQNIEVDKTLEGAGRLTNALNMVMDWIRVENVQTLIVPFKWAGSMDNVPLIEKSLACSSTLSDDDTQMLLSLAFEYAAFSGSIRVVTYLLNKNVNGSQSFVSACLQGHVDVVGLMLKTGVMEIQDLVIGFHAACLQGHVRVIRMLMETEMVVITEFHFETAGVYGHLEVVRYFLDEGFEATSVSLLRVLVEAAERGDGEMVKFIIDVPGVDPSADDNRALLHAARGGAAGAAGILLEREEVRVKAKENGGDILERAVFSNSPETVMVFMESRCFDDFVENALAWARRCGFLEVTRILEGVGVV